MSARGRPKRQAAQSAPIIEISDSEDEIPEKRNRVETNKTIERASQATAGIGNHSNRQRWPDKNKKNNASQKELSSSTDQQVENLPPNVPENNISNTQDSQPSCSQQHQRNSFWERRKVWTIPELLAESENINTNAASNIVQLLNNENTIPFICRYRRDLIDHLTPERLRSIKNTYTDIVGLRKKAENIVTQLEKENAINEEVREEIMCAKTSEELEFLYAPYKPANKGSLADRAKALGLEVYADRLLYGEKPQVQLSRIVQSHLSELDSEKKVLDGICNIISHKMSKHTAVLEELRKLQQVHRIFLKTSKSKSTAASKEKNSSSLSSKTTTSDHKNNRLDESKFETYLDFQCDVKNMKPHQVLAINRGEKNKFLSVKLLIPDYLKNAVKSVIYDLFMTNGLKYTLRQEVFEKSFEECFTKKLQPLLTRQIRADLDKVAKLAAIDVFAKNLKQLLLTSPLKGEKVLGIDPGFRNGCKMALISETSNVLETEVIYPHGWMGNEEAAAEKLVKLLTKYNCKIIALGNGTACRETENWLTKLFDSGMLDGNMVRYSIVSENGASIYSCSEVARKEFPDMDMNEISAVSIARRLNDPLSEYVKIEPRHIGVGMYQHDVNEKVLTESLNEVVSECVSFVGVDINTASLSVLKHIAGLSEKKAEKIIEYRNENGPFRKRQDLLKVKSIGEKTFVQCAGFIRIEPRSVGGKISNILDCTWVHPESYDIAKKIIKKCKLNLLDIGTEPFIEHIKQATTTATIQEIADEFKIPRDRLDIVFVALQRKLNQDYRADLVKRPLFKQGTTKITSLNLMDVVTGAVTNVTHFGAFVDIGVECNALIHISKMNNTKLNIGDRVTASVIQLDIKRRRIGLRLEDMLQETDTSFTFKSEVD